MSGIIGVGERALHGALLGTGSISAYQLRAWREIPKVEIVALANRTRARALALGQEFDIPAPHIYADYRDLLVNEKIDFVDIATAPQIHREQVLAAAACGIHSLCQKPFARSLKEAREMIVACQVAGVRCVVNENWRWRRWYRLVKALLEQNVVGTPRYARFLLHNGGALPNAEGSLPPLRVQQSYTAEMPHLILFEWGIHFVDVLRFLFGDIVRVYARMSRVSPLFKGEDLAVVILEFSHGMTGLIDISWGSRISEQKQLVRGNLDPFVVEGDRGSIELDPYQDDSIKITTGQGTERRPAREHLTPTEAYQESYFNTQRHFIQCLRTGAPAENEATDNWKTLAAVMAAYDSADCNQVVEPSVLNEVKP